MRLLNVHTFKFAWFESGDPTPKYAILSHRWQQYEPDQADIEQGRNDAVTRKVRGFAQFVSEALPHIKWIWIDTCCIAQTNSVERSESINLMFDYYHDAEICVALLADVEDPHSQSSFRQSVWFTRGWTLQELLAADLVIFVTNGWELIGHKGKSGRYQATGLTGPNLDGIISQITRVPQAVLQDFDCSQKLSVDEKLEWMNGRYTLREEDKVYAMFGIFGVCPGTNYGEKFARAQGRLFFEISTKMMFTDPPEYFGRPQNMLPNHEPRVEVRLGSGLRRQLADMTKRVEVLRMAGQLPEAVQQQLVILDKTSALPQGLDQLHWYAAMLDLGDLYHMQGHLHEARALKEKALSGQRRMIGDSDKETSNTMSSLATTYRRLGMVREAERLDLAVLQGLESRLGECNLETQALAAAIARDYRSQARLTEAEQLQGKVIQRFHAGGHYDSPELFLALFELASTLEQQHRYSESYQLAQQSLAGQTRVLGEIHADTAMSQALVARLEFLLPVHARRSVQDRPVQAGAQQTTRISGQSSLRKLFGFGRK